MDSETLPHEKLESFRIELVEAVGSACAKFEAELHRARDEIATLRNQVTALERDKDALKLELDAKQKESEIQQSGYAKLYDAHRRVKDRVRYLRNWIDSCQKYLPEEFRWRAHEGHPLSDTSSISRADSPTSEDQLNPPTREPRHARSTGLTDGAGSGSNAATSQPNNKEAPDVTVTAPIEIKSEPVHSASDPVTESTETASAVASQGATKAPSCAQMDSDSDVPLVVFERSLKRKRSIRREAYVKPEPLSPQWSLPEPATLDLDEVSIPLDPDSNGQAILSAHPAGNKKRCVSEGIVNPCHDQVKMQSEAKSGRAGSSPLRTPRNRAFVEAIIHEDSDEITFTCAQPAHDSSTGHESPKLPRLKQSRVLQLKTANPRAPTPSNIDSSALPRKIRLHDDLWLQICGEDRLGSEDENLVDPGHPSPMLQELLEPAHRLNAPLLVPCRRSTRGDHARRGTGPLRHSRQLVTPLSTAKSSTRATEPTRNLRLRQPEELRPEDFRHNPARNDGVDFAFSEVVRGKDHRKCLPGCNNPDCCGQKFSRVVQIGGFATPHRPSLGDALRGEPDQFENDDQILRSYLGEGASRLEYMSNAEREDLLHKAKVQAFGQSHGKHRNQHARPPSPPGYWRTDMPSTQEIKKDRDAANLLQQRTVQERWREALQPDGRWVFRDE